MIRNPLQPYSPAILALFFGGCVLACYAFARAFEKPQRHFWGEDHAS